MYEKHEDAEALDERNGYNGRDETGLSCDSWVLRLQRHPYWRTHSCIVVVSRHLRMRKMLAERQIPLQSQAVSRAVSWSENSNHRLGSLTFFRLKTQHPSFETVTEPGAFEQRPEVMQITSKPRG